MSSSINALLIALAVGSALPQPLLAQPQTADESSDQRISVCSLLPKEEVRTHLPWPPLLDGMPVEEEPIGTSGSSCNYPSVFIQVLAFSQGTMDAVRAMAGVESISTVGDEAYFRNNADQYAELYVRAGGYLLTLQANVDGTIETVKPGVVDLAKALVAKLHAARRTG